MDELRNLEKEIEFLRQRMHKLIEKDSTLISKEILDISQRLDKILTEYHLIKADMKNE